MFNRISLIKVMVLAIVLIMPVRDVIASEGNQVELKGGTAKVNINPPVGGWLSGWAIRDKPSEGIADNLYAKAIVLADGKTEIALVAADLIGVTAEIVSEVRKAVEEKTGIPGDNILISATHTHFGPAIRDMYSWKVDKDYLEVLKRQLASVVIMAHRDMGCVKVGMAKGQAPELLYNRRTKRPDGKVTMTFVLPPTEENLTFGPVDPEVGVLRMEDNEGKLLASMINFACHPVSGGGHGEGWESWFYDISADYPAYAMEVVENIEGGNCLFTLGTAGNMVPIRRGISPRFEIGRALGGEALRRLQFLETRDDLQLVSVRREIKLLLKEKQSDDSSGSDEKSNRVLITEVQGIRIGDIYLLGLPGEVLVELGLEIKKRAGTEKLILISLANDTIGYICHKEAYAEGGYEPIEGSRIKEGSGETVVEEALKAINQLKNGE